MKKSMLVSSFGAVLGALALLSFCAPAAQADQISGARAKEICAKHEVGPISPYGETAEEVAAKRTVFEWQCLFLVERKADEARAKYISPKWCDHSHNTTHGKKLCGTWEDTTRFLSNFSTGTLKDSDIIEFPLFATVDGGHVTEYGEGVDSFLVVDGKITDHWDASPPAAVSIKAHDPSMAQRVMSGEGPPGPPPSGQK